MGKLTKKFAHNKEQTYLFSCKIVNENSSMPVCVNVMDQVADEVKDETDEMIH